MSDLSETPIYIAAHQPPSATAQGEDVAMTITVVGLTLPDHLGEIVVQMPRDFAKHAIVQLGDAVAQAIRNSHH
jgi:hypothetical protein